MRAKVYAAVFVVVGSGCELVAGLSGVDEPYPVDGGAGGLAASCENGVRDGDETDVDCGGPCTACPDGDGCTTGSDCENRVCSAGICLAATCTDKVKNGDEIDADCAGSCGPCGPGKKCEDEHDCVSGTCVAGLCVSTCSDALQGAAETDVDCGGGECAPCADGKHCKSGADCKSVICKATICSPNYVWAQHFGGAGYATPLSFAADGDGNSLVAGQFQGNVNLGSGPLTAAGGNDAFVAKYDPTGAPLWSRQFGDAQDQAIYGIAATPAGNVIVAGAFQGTITFGPLLTSAGSQDVFVGALSASGAPLWSKRLGDATFQSAAGVAVDATGNVFVLGSFDGTITFGASQFTSVSGQDMFVAKLDAAGAPIWFKSFGSAQASPHGRSIGADASGNVVVAGDFGGSITLGGGTLVSAGASDIFVASFNSGGNHIWSARFGDTSQQLYPRVAVDGAGNVLLAGNFTGTIDLGGGALASANGNHVFLAKFDGAGKHLWSKQFGDDQTFPSVSALAVADAGAVALAGSFAGMLDLGGGGLTASSAGGDAFLGKFDASGGFLWNGRFGGVQAQFPHIRGVAFAGSANVLIAGDFSGTVDFGGGAVTSIGSSDLFLIDLQVP